MKKALSLMLAVALVALMIPFSNVEAEESDKNYAGCMIQHENRWLKYSFNGGTLPATGCGIFALVNCVGYLTGRTMDVVEVATWAHDIGAFNVYGADGTYRLELYPKVEAKYGKEYGITVDCDYDDGGYWEDSSSSRLKNHLLGGGVALAHVPGHFIAIVDYDPTTDKYHVYDSSPSPKRGTNVNNGDLWVSAVNLSLNVFKMDWFCLIASKEKDKQKPVITDVKYSDVSASGYTVSCTVADDFYVGNVAFPTWTVEGGQDDLPKNYMVTQTGTRVGNTISYKVLASKHNKETEGYITHIYAEDRGGNVTILELPPVNLIDDKEKPVITDVKVFDRTTEGYKISCKVTDNWGVDRVAFPVWTSNNGQDDLKAGFLDNELGTKDGDTYTFEVKASEHGGELGEYITHIYGIDCSGNQITYEVEPIIVADEKTNILVKIPSAYKVSGKYLLGVGELTTVDSLLENFENEGLVVSKSEGAVEGEEVVGNGFTVSLLSGADVVDSMIAIIFGDTNGSGKIDSEDCELIKNAILNETVLEEVVFTSADMDGSESLDVTDYINVKFKSLGI